MSRTPPRRLEISTETLLEDLAKGWGYWLVVVPKVTGNRKCPKTGSKAKNSDNGQMMWYFYFLKYAFSRQKTRVLYPKWCVKSDSEVRFRFHATKNDKIDIFFPSLWFLTLKYEYFSGTCGYPWPSKLLRVNSPNLELGLPKKFGSISLIASEEFDSQGWIPIKKNSSLIFNFLVAFNFSMLIIVDILLTSFYFEWMWTSEAPRLPDYTNDSSIDLPWLVDLGKTQKKFSKKILRFLSAIMLFLCRLTFSYTGRWLVSFAPPFIQNWNSSL